MLLQRPRTRLAYPLPSQLRFLAVALVYWLLGRLLSPAFRRTVRLEDLSRARLLILKPCCLGDVVFSTPLVRELRQALPGAQLTYAVGSHSRVAVAGQPTIDAILETGPVGSGPYRLADYLRLIQTIRAHHFDACFVLERSARLVLIPWLAGIPIRIGIDSGGRGFSLSVAVSTHPARPESELYLDLLRAIGGTPRSGVLEYQPPAEALRRVDQLIQQHLPAGRPFVILHCAGGVNPGMTLARKRWPVARFQALARRILDAGASVVLVGSPADRETIGRWESATGPNGAGVVDLIGQLTLEELAALARRGSAYVGNDSGPSHLAEAAGARVIMLFGPSDPIVYGPRSPHAVALTAGIWCSPCFENGRVAPCANVICMDQIPVERVWRAVARCLASEERVR